MSVHEKYQAARNAIFALEEALGPYGDITRRAVYALRVHLGQIAGAHPERFAPPATDEAARRAKGSEER